jgi:outer membrane beta-barrel protein
MVKLLPLFLLVTAASTALADRRNPLEGQPAIRNKVELRKLRFEISPQFLVQINPDYKHAFGVGANLQFHITDWIGVGIEGAYLFNSNTALENEIRDKLPTGDYMYPGPQPTRAIHDQHTMGINALMSAYASLTPWAGKFSLFSALFFNYDFYANVGIGLVNWVQDPKCCTATPVVVHSPSTTGETIGDPNTEDASQFAGLKVGGLIGFGVHIYFNDWIGMQLELRDYIHKANPGGGDKDGDRHLCSGQGTAPCNGNSDESIQNSIFFGVGVTLMLPPRAKITH